MVATPKSDRGSATAKAWMVRVIIVHAGLTLFATFLQITNCMKTGIKPGICTQIQGSLDALTFPVTDMVATPPYSLFLLPLVSILWGCAAFVLARLAMTLRSDVD